MDFKDLNDIANYINKGKEDYEIDEDPIIEDLVNSFEHIGLLDHVYAFNDDVHCLRNISDELKKKKISEVTEKDEEEIDELLEITSGISYYNDREITDDILEEIKEDKMYRGENIDDL